MVRWSERNIEVHTQLTPKCPELPTMKSQIASPQESKVCTYHQNVDDYQFSVCPSVCVIPKHR